METMERISAHLAKRAIELKKMKQQGTKIVGYFPNGYTPEELIYACNAIPVGLVRGGDPEAVAESAVYTTHFLDTFCRSQIGYWSSKEEPFYQIIDKLIVAITENNVRSVADCFSYFTDIDVFRHGVPRIMDNLGLDYYLEGLQKLAQKLESLTGNKIEISNLQKSVELSNRMGELLKKISLMRKCDPPKISGKDFIRLNHASYVADREEMITVLGSLVKELEHKEVAKKPGPRVILTGSTLAMGDYKLIDILEQSGASVVCEEFSEGIRDYWNSTDTETDPLKALAQRCFMNRVPPAHFRGMEEARLNFLVQLYKEFKADGIIWYQLLYRESYEVQSLYFENKLREMGIPMLKLSSDYSVSEIGPLKTRVETFVEGLRVE